MIDKKQYMKEYRKKNKKKIKIYMKKYRKEHVEQISEQSKKWQYENNEHINNVRKGYRKIPVVKKRISELDKKRNQNPERIEYMKKARKKYRENNREKVRQQNREYNKRHPEKAIEKSKRYIKKYGLNTTDLNIWGLLIRNKFDNTCQTCGSIKDIQAHNILYK